ncbi:MAG: SemiSWEET transporter [Thermoplasmata archaeon]|jgi:MtN3 and saliva related transmembrane protein
MDLPTWTITLIGSLAGACTTVAFLPQVIRVWRMKRADEISLTTFLVFSVGVLVWLVYGLLVASWPIIIANGVTLLLSLTIVSLKLKWDRSNSPTPS